MAHTWFRIIVICASIIVEKAISNCANLYLIKAVPTTESSRVGRIWRGVNGGCPFQLYILRDAVEHHRAIRPHFPLAFWHVKESTYLAKYD